MEKIAAGPAAADVIDINAPVKANLEAVAKALGEKVSDVTAVILDRDRHADIIRECREAGARIRLIPDGDVAGAISVAWRNSGNDILFGIGGTPEGVIAACALKCLGGSIQGRLWPRNDDERTRRARRGLRPRQGAHARRSRLAATTCSSRPPASPTASCCSGVRYWGDGAGTQSLVMRSKSGTIRMIDAHAPLDEADARTPPSATNTLYLFLNLSPSPGLRWAGG